MKLQSPFQISARLAPALKIADAWLSFADGRFVFDLPDGSEHVVTDFHFPRINLAGSTPESILQEGFASMLAFLSACAESRAYVSREGRSGENADLFPENVGQWTESVSDELQMLQCEIEETKNLLTA